MTRRRLAFALLASAGVLVAHVAGYAVPSGGHGELGHGYVLPALALVAPVAVVLAVTAAVAEARRVGLALELSPGRLLGAQVALYAVQEVGERLLHGGIGSLAGQRGLALGLLAQVPVALLLWALVRLARRVATRLFATPSIRPARQRRPSPPPVADGGARPRWSPLSSRAPPLPA